MTEVSVKGTYGDTVVTAGKEYFECFTMAFAADGTATVSVKYATGMTDEQAAVSAVSDGKIHVTTSEGGISVTESYDFTDGVISYERKVSVPQQGTTIEMPIKLAKTA